MYGFICNNSGGNGGAGVIGGSGAGGKRISGDRNEPAAGS